MTVLFWYIYFFTFPVFEFPLYMIFFSGDIFEFFKKPFFECKFSQSRKKSDFFYDCAINKGMGVG